MPTFEAWDGDEVGWLTARSVIEHSITPWSSFIMSSILEDWACLNVGGDHPLPAKRWDEVSWLLAHFLKGMDTNQSLKASRLPDICQTSSEN